MQHHFGLTLAEALEALAAAMTNTSYRYRSGTLIPFPLIDAVIAFGQRAPVAVATSGRVSVRIEVAAAAPKHRPQRCAFVLLRRGGHFLVAEDFQQCINRNADSGDLPAKCAAPVRSS